MFALFVPINTKRFLVRIPIFLPHFRLLFASWLLLHHSTVLCIHHLENLLLQRGHIVVVQLVRVHLRIQRVEKQPEQIVIGRHVVLHHHRVEPLFHLSLRQIVDDIAQLHFGNVIRVVYIRNPFIRPLCGSTVNSESSISAVAFSSSKNSSSSS